MTGLWLFACAVNVTLPGASDGISELLLYSGIGTAEVIHKPGNHHIHITVAEIVGNIVQ